MKYDRKDNPGLGRSDGESVGDYMLRISEVISKLEWQSEGHRMWYTHKNPYSCWICETFQVCRYLETELLDRGRSDDESDEGRESEIEQPGEVDIND